MGPWRGLLHKGLNILNHNAKFQMFAFIPPYQSPHAKVRHPLYESKQGKIINIISAYLLSIQVSHCGTLKQLCQTLSHQLKLDNQEK